MEKQVRHAQDMRQMFFFNAGKAVLNGTLICFSFRLLAQVLDCAGEEATGATGRIEDDLPKARINLLNNELGDGPGSIELAGVAS